MQIYQGTLELHEHTYFASREVGALFQTEPLIGNYALAYALGLCHAPYRWGGGPRYKEDLGPLNETGVYVTPATFAPGRLRFAIQQFNAQADSYWSAYDNNAIRTARGGPKARPANFPQAGKLRLLGLGSVAVFYLLDGSAGTAPRPRYVRLGKFNSKARVAWEELSHRMVHRGDEEVPFLLNPVDLPEPAALRVFHLYSVHPTPLVSHARLSGPFYELANGVRLPAGMRFGVDAL